MKKSIIYLLLIVFIIRQCKKDTESPWSAERMAEVRGYENWYIDNFRCGIFVPPTYDPGKEYPLILYLHGHTDTTTWNLGWYNEPIVTHDPCIVLTPKCPKEEIYSISMGGYGTYGVLQKNPDLFAAAYVECGKPNISIAPIIDRFLSCRLFEQLHIFSSFSYDPLNFQTM